jgi:hypothetical protein
MKPPRTLLIGCGRSRVKQIQYDGNPEWIGALTTLDISPTCGADIVFDMQTVADGGRMPFDDDTFDEISILNAQEHWGRQGLVPIGRDALSDPGHCRFFAVVYFNFLNQQYYELNEVKSTCFTDYRGWAWSKNFDVLYLQEHGGHHIAAVLRKA